MIERCLELLNTTDITLGMSILVAVISSIIINLLFSCYKLVGKVFKYLGMKILCIIKAVTSRVLKYRDYKKRERAGNLTLVERLLKIDPKEIEDIEEIETE